MELIKKSGMFDYMKDKKFVGNYKLECERLNTEASDNREDSYLDPKTGQTISTTYYLKHLRKCCKGGCRHCPFGFKKRS